MRKYKKSEIERKFYSIHKIEKSLKHHVIEWVASILTILGALLTANLNIYGFAFFFVANSLWIAFSLKHRHYGLLTVSIFLLCTNMYSIYQWSVLL